MILLFPTASLPRCSSLCQGFLYWRSLPPKVSIVLLFCQGPMAHLFMPGFRLYSSFSKSFYCSSPLPSRVSFVLPFLAGSPCYSSSCQGFLGTPLPARVYSCSSSCQSFFRAPLPNRVSVVLFFLPRFLWCSSSCNVFLQIDL